ncbi:MAG: DM13 domain-containing protein [Corynebacteriales bacterium]|nr:DM13 domain-containing protein [Mycobacteriales bacterium]
MRQDQKRLAIEWAARLVGMGLVWAAIAIWRPGILGGLWHSPRAITAIVVGFAVLVGIEWLLRQRGWPKVGRGVFYSLLIIGIVAAVAPSFINKTVNEKESDTFRDAQAAPSADASSSAPPTSPIELGQAELSGIDHRASGTVRVVQDVDGRMAVRFENLDVEPGPDYFMWLVPGEDRDSPDDGSNMGRIKANKGDQEYRADADFRADRPLTVLIWCRAFAVPVANATIS